MSEMSRYDLALVALQAVEKATGLACDLMEFPPGISLLFGGGKGVDPVISMTIELQPGRKGLGTLLSLEELEALRA